MKKVISFSIYGDQPMYTVGLLRNLELSKNIYPDWKVYVYYNNTVPEDFINQYKEFDNCECFDMSNYNIPGMFWRFTPKDGVERFISRDADSRLSMREKMAVDEWISSGKSLHIMRDHPHHDVCIFGGMFGLKINDDFILEYKINEWIVDKDKSLFNRMGDVYFLRDVVYPKYINGNEVLAHDSIYLNKYPFSKPFPTPMEDYKFVGEIYNSDDSRYPQFMNWIGKKEIRNEKTIGDL